MGLCLTAAISADRTKITNIDLAIYSSRTAVETRLAQTIIIIGLL